MPRDGRPQNNKPWFKKWSQPWLTGSIRFDCTPAERSVFDDLLCLANENRNRGVIQANASTPYTHIWIAQTLNLQIQFLEDCLKKFEVQERIHEDEHGITVLNFKFYNDDTEAKPRGRPPRNRNQGELPFDTGEDPAPVDTLSVNPEAADIWARALREIKTLVSGPNYRTWLEKTVGYDIKDNLFIVSVPNDFVRDYLETNQITLIEKTLGSVAGRSMSPVFRSVKEEDTDV